MSKTDNTGFPRIHYFPGILASIGPADETVSSTRIVGDGNAVPRRNKKPRLSKHSMMALLEKQERKQPYPVRDLLVEYLDMVVKQLSGGPYVRRFNTGPKDVIREEMDRMDLVDVAKISATLRSFEMGERFLAEIDRAQMDKKGKHATRFLEQFYADHPNMQAPPFSNEEEALRVMHKLAATISLSACYLARQHMAYSDFVCYESIPLLLEGLTVEAINVIVRECEKCGNNKLADLWLECLTYNANINEMVDAMRSCENTT
jgi:hypothetical protein